MIGEIVGNFEIVSQLGKGGMGEVWLAEQKTLKTKAAIKILAAGVSNVTHVQRFHNEAMAVAQIPHSGIVKIFDSGMIAGRAYLVMEYLQGETLASRIKRMGQLELMLMCDFGRQIASVLDATHGAGITHRDLKPENIYIVRDAEMPHGERIKILDFGIAKLDVVVGPRMTAVGASSIGTPNYMSPEQWHSLAEADWRTDAYALGCVAFEMACGRPPFIARSRVEVCAMHLETPPPVPSTLRPGLPGPFDVVVAKLLDKEPENRPTMREVMGVFAALGEQAGVMLATLPPQGMRSPFAASDSIGYKVTPRAGFESQTGMPKATDATPLAGTPIVGNAVREDATPVADMSLQFRVTPRSGFASQNDMPVFTEGPQRLRGASQGQQMQAVKRRPLLWVLGIGGVVIAVTIVIAVIGARNSKQIATPSVGTASGSGSAIAAVRDTAPPKQQLPARIEPAQMPDLAAPLEVVVCIDPRGEVDDVKLPSGANIDRAVEVKVLSWTYKANGVTTRICGPVTIPARAAAEGVLPERLTPKLFDNGLGAVHEAIFDCADLGSGTFTVEIEVSPAGAGKITKLALPPNKPTFEQCIRAAVAKAPFAKTKLGGKGKTTVQLGG